MRTTIPLLFLLTAAGALAGSTLSIVRQGDGYSLLRNGQPYFVKGAVGAVHLEELAAAGGNSIRADVTALDRAQALGLSVLIDLKTLHGDLGYPLSALIEYAVQE